MSGRSSGGESARRDASTVFVTFAPRAALLPLAPSDAPDTFDTPAAPSVLAVSAISAAPDAFHGLDVLDVLVVLVVLVVLGVFDGPLGSKATAMKVSSGVAALTPGRARTVRNVLSGSHARSATGFALCLTLVLPFFFSTVVWWTFWSAEMTSGAAA
ncbi:hypothetical protein GCM10010326_34470 [Streptomyces xanthochromogenes]|uniref:Uncharacterized protein n=1 Tax=Streptomyces xanthochromogenes TaxID=67384 RepID=A0ABQ3A612_9ACTN|nr:hypothetical protein GCM10010326_34470 [Streptomyces xanthochromogenes]